MASFNKKIWFLWLQGKSEMPEIVKLCYDSWSKHNKNWKIIFLSNDNLADYLDLTKILPFQKTISFQSQSNIIRINLLNRYGGVWVDSTCFCMKPLDSWINENLTSGFFAFSKPGIDRMLSSWFLAAKPENALVDIYCKNVNKFWLKNPEIKQITPAFAHFLSKSKLNYILLRKPTLWYTTFFLKVLKRHPYHWFHYLFEVVYKKDEIFRKIWNETPIFSADFPHKLLFFGLNEPVTKELKKEIDSQEIPLYKLSWRLDFNSSNKNSVFNYLKKIE